VDAGMMKKRRFMQSGNRSVITGTTFSSRHRDFILPANLIRLYPYKCHRRVSWINYREKYA